MRPTLILQPTHTTSTDILKCFLSGKPLSSEQIHFLDWHQKQLSNPAFDPIIKYYLQTSKNQRVYYKSSFLLPHEKIDAHTLQELRKRLNAFLLKDYHHVMVHFTPKQFLEFKAVGVQELIFWHGNQFLTGAPFFPGGIPPVIFFQWGNLFGVVKYLALVEEKALKANVLIYFEDMQDRNFEQCVLDYKRTFANAQALQNTILLEHKLKPNTFDKFLIKTPVLLAQPSRTR